MKSPLRWAAAPLAVLALAACNPSDDSATDAGVAPEPSSRTLGASLKGDGELDTLETVIAGSGLESVLDGVGPYTVFAPTDAAFTAAGGDDLSDPEMKARNAALLRAHIVPGALTRADILAAIDRETTGKVEMRTMGEGLLAFTRDGDAIVVTAPDGASARLTGEQTLAENGVLQPVDGVLVAAEAQPAAG